MEKRTVKNKKAKVNRRDFLSKSLLGAGGITIMPLAFGTNKDEIKMENALRPKVIFFDVNETLLDLTPIKESVGKALGGRSELVALWLLPCFNIHW